MCPYMSPHVPRCPHVPPGALTMSGSQRDSHMPYICSEQVPLSTKSSVTMGQPMRSSEQRKGRRLPGSSPAITGSAGWAASLRPWGDLPVPLGPSLSFWDHP
ncbi:hypothetical protein DV515_00019889 [Chloebia gouldiae]|uniref:Uncharacterized protein n=1 Tax=Chloebia gouldiae TaxID=44316 RepID=A0A3L8Q3C5_CHLGU|nr:hypothetical protein DV515_00019889 [Chloebia gouldiae]